MSEVAVTYRGSTTACPLLRSQVRDVRPKTGRTSERCVPGLQKDVGSDSLPTDAVTVSFDTSTRVPGFSRRLLTLSLCQGVFVAANKPCSAGNN